VFFWFGARSIGPILRVEPVGEGRYHLVTQSQRHPIRLSQAQVAEVAVLLGQS
jgi:hypothetical protein